MQNQTPDFPGTSADHLHHGPFNTKSRQKQIAKEKSDHNCLFGSPIWRSNFDRRFHFLASLAANDTLGLGTTYTVDIYCFLQGNVQDSFHRKATFDSSP